MKIHCGSWRLSREPSTNDRLSDRRLIGVFALSSAPQPPSENPTANKDSQKTRRAREMEEDLERIDPSTVPEMSVEDVDNLLAEENPEFLKSIASIAQDKSLTVEQIIIDDAELALNAEIDLWRSYSGWRKIVYTFFPFAPHFALRLKALKFWIVAFAVGQKIKLLALYRYLKTQGRQQAMVWIKRRKKKIEKVVVENIESYRSLSPRVKIFLFVSLGLGALALGIVYLAATGRLIPKEKEVYLAGFDTHASETYTFDPETEVEPYINNARMAQNLYLTPKIFVNLKPAPIPDPTRDSENPMGGFEFFIEGMSSEVVVEVKDREAMTHDLINQVVHEMTFAQLDTAEGKAELCNRIRSALNKVLVTGRVQNVRIKTIIIKP